MNGADGYEEYSDVISRYLWMFSLEISSLPLQWQEYYVISRYLWMFSLDALAKQLEDDTFELFPVILGCSH